MLETFDFDDHDLLISYMLRVLSTFYNVMYYVQRSIIIHSIIKDFHCSNM